MAEGSAAEHVVVVEGSAAGLAVVEAATAAATKTVVGLANAIVGRVHKGAHQLMRAARGSPQLAV